MFRMGENGGSLEPRMMEPELRNNGSSQSEEQPASGQKSVKSSVRKKKSLRARYAYGVIFLLTNIIAWLFRDYGERILPVLPYSRACGAEERECYHTMGVLRIFFFLMFVTTCNTRKLHEKRNAWHSGWWALKFVLLLISFVIPFFIPTDYIQLYGELARVGAGIFLILQLVSVIEFITWWNNYWMSDEKNKSSCSIGLFMSTVFYIASVCGIAVMYVLYASKTSCSLNIFFISWTGVLLIVMMVISLHSRVNRGLLSSGIMAFTLFSYVGLPLEANRAAKNAAPKSKKVDMVGFVIALCAIVIATFSTGIDSQTFQFCKNRAQLLEDDVPYSYGFFHLVFSLGAMYFAMLLISWNLGSLTRNVEADFPVLKETKVMNHEDSIEEV
ncbi:Serine incorporator 2 [Sesamum angolense]|uniref:Serine incorporator 2 n=1 Tax=Sesamum angolense TaxID=2727404 RepID=A0AAE1X6C1_9LAMI|nr:Serine incorporator 2 [Sesamum angolense]